jgi:hypothetical protein
MALLKALLEALEKKTSRGVADAMFEAVYSLVAAAAGKSDSD